MLRELSRKVILLANFSGGSSSLTFAKVHSTKLSHHKTLKKVNSDAIVGSLSRKQKKFHTYSITYYFQIQISVANSMIVTHFICYHLHMIPYKSLKNKTMENNTYASINEHSI